MSHGKIFPQTNVPGLGNDADLCMGQDFELIRVGKHGA